MQQMRAGWTSVLICLLSTSAGADDDEKHGSAAVQLVEPDTLNGRPKVTDPKVQESLAALERRVADAIPGEETVVAALYGHPQAEDTVQILAVDRASAQGDRDLDEIFQPLRDKGWKVSELEPVDPGPLGGSAKCADVTTPSGEQSMCAWADTRSVGSVTFYLKKREDLKREFVGIRSLIERIP